MADSWFDLVPNSNKDEEDDPDITDTGHFAEIIPAIQEVFKIIEPYRREKPLRQDGETAEEPADDIKEGTSSDNVKDTTVTDDSKVGNGEQTLHESSSENDDSSSSDDGMSSSEESSSSSESEIEDINLVQGFTKLDLDGMLKKATQRVNLRKLFKPGEYEELCRFEQKRIIRIENKLTLMLRLKLPLPNENIIREKVGLSRRDIILRESSDSESDEEWATRRRKTSSVPALFRGINDDDTAARMAFIEKYCEERQSGKRQVLDVPRRKIVKPTKIRTIAEVAKPSFEAFKKVEMPQDGSGDGASTSSASGEGPSKYNTRKSDKKYEEEYVPEDDHFVFCDDCKKLYVDDCPEHPLTVMKDTVSEKGKDNYAKRTCPPGLSVDPSSVRHAGYGVWADVAIPKNTVFGPYQGEIIKKYDVKKLVKVCNGGYSWEIYKKEKLIHYVDGSDPKISNWMRYVNCARCEEEQNLLAFQYKGRIYYRAFSDISMNTELFVWYGSHYASQLGIQEKLEKKTDSIINRHAVISTKPAENFPRTFKSGYTVNSDSTKNKIEPSLPSPEKKSSWNCSVCEKCFSSKNQLGDHIKLFHNNIKNRMCCYCGKVLAHASSLKMHQRTHTGEKPYKCDVCGDRFTRIGHLKRHERTHTGEKPYKCDICGDRFTMIGSLKRHERTHTGEKPYKCDICGDRFTMIGSLKRHERTHTGEKPYKCDICGDRFTQLGHLKIHERTHTGEKPYKCDICGERYTSNANLKYHKRTHTGEKPYKCDSCGKKFTRSSTRNAHMKKCRG